MALRKSVQAAYGMQAPGALSASAPVGVAGQHVTVAAQMALNDVIEMIPIPSGCIFHSLHIHFPDLDSGGPTITVDVGVMTGKWLQNTVDNDGVTARTVGQEFGAALTTPQAGGSLVATAAQMAAVAPSLSDRSLGIKVAAAATTPVVGAKITATAVFIPAPQGMAFA